MIDHWLQKSKINKGMKWFVEKYLLNKVSANSLTLSGLILGLLSAFTIFLSGLLNYILELIIISAVLMTLSFFIDTLDGAIARLEGTTIFGGILDIFCDRFVELSLILAIISTAPHILMWAGLFTLSAIILCITIFLLIGNAFKSKNSESSKKVIFYSGGIMERSETFIFLFIIVIFPVLRCVLLWSFALLIFITALQRLFYAYKIFYKKNNNRVS